MSDDRIEPLPDEYIALLVDYDEALACRDEGPSRDVPIVGADAQLASRVSRARHCLQLIDRVRRSDPDTFTDFITPGAVAGEALQIPGFTAAPTHFGRFQIVRELGRGGHGVVFLAVDPKLGREIALKVPRPEMVMADELRERFLREGRAVAGLNHANLLPVYEAGKAGAVCYLAAAYCRGPSLAAWLADRSQPVSPRQAAGILVKVADAMQHAHGRGVIHRDLKPGNILLDRSDRPAGENSADPSAMDTEPLVPLVTDFGLARIIDDQQRQTRDGAIMGTPAYMAPEQAAGRREEVGPATDIYSLGCILYELLTGHPPFCRETSLATLRAVEREEPAPPRRVRGDVPRDLEAVCLKCLEKSPQRRYTSASELSDDLQRYLDGRPVRARHVGSAERVIRWCRRNPAVAGLVSAVLVLLLTLSVGSTIAAIQLNRERSRTAGARDAAQRNYHEADRQRKRAEDHLRTVRRAVDDMLTEVGFNRLASQPYMGPIRRRLLEQALEFYQQIRRQSGRTPAARNDVGLALLRLGMVNGWLGNYQDAADNLTRAADHFKALRADYPGRGAYGLQQAVALYQLAQLQEQLLQYEEARDTYQSALALFSESDVQRTEETEQQSRKAEILGSYGAFLYRSGEMADAEPRLREAIAIQRSLRKTLPTDRKTGMILARCLHNLALLLGDTNRAADSERCFGESLPLMKGLVEKTPLPENRQSLSDVYDDLGSMLLRAGELTKAERAYRQALEIRDKLAREFPKVPLYRSRLASSYGNLAWLYTKDQRGDEADQAYRQAISVLTGIASDPAAERALREQLAHIQNNFAILLTSLGQKEEAEKLTRESVDVRRALAEDFASVPECQSQLAASLHTLAVLLKKRGDNQAARPLLDEAVRRQSAALKANPQHPTYRKFLRNHYVVLADVLLALGEYAQAAECQERRLELYPDSWSEYYLATRGLRMIRDKLTQDESKSSAQRERLADALRRRELECLEESLARVPETVRNPNDLNNLSVLLAVDPDAGFRRPALAVQYMQRVVKQYPDHENARFFFATLGMAYVAAEEWPAGIKTLEKARELKNEATMGVFALAIAHAKVGHNEQALQYYHQGLDRLEEYSVLEERTRYLRDRAAKCLGLDGT